MLKPTSLSSFWVGRWQHFLPCLTARPCPGGQLWLKGYAEKWYVHLWARTFSSSVRLPSSPSRCCGSCGSHGFRWWSCQTETARSPESPHGQERPSRVARLTSDTSLLKKYKPLLWWVTDISSFMSLQHDLVHPSKNFLKMSLMYKNMYLCIILLYVNVLWNSLYLPFLT